jgi:hypothetical protein
MIALLTTLLLGCEAPAPPPPAEPPPPVEQAPAPPPAHQRLEGAAQLVQLVGKQSPRILGVGELHQVVDGPQGPAAIDWFTDELLPLLAPTATDLVIETWVFEGGCGEQEEVVAEVLPEATQRPEQVEDSIVRLARVARELGVTPHALELSCDDYEAVTGPEGEIVYDQLLLVMTRELGELAELGLETPDARVILYGGAVHNDLHPRPALAAYSYATGLADLPGGHAYVELDLYPPAMARAQAGFADEAWYPLLERAGPAHLVVYERDPRSLVVLLPTTPHPQPLSPEGRGE